MNNTATQNFNINIGQDSQMSRGDSASNMNNNNSELGNTLQGVGGGSIPVSNNNNNNSLANNKRLSLINEKQSGRNQAGQNVSSNNMNTISSGGANQMNSTTRFDD